MSPAATKAEAQANLTRAREKAGKAHLARGAANTQLDQDAANAHYDRCVREFEECINDMGNFDDGEATD